MARILLVEDDPHIRITMRNALLNAKHEVVDVDHGRRGMALLQGQPYHQPFDLVITEMLLPEVDGVEIIRTARILNPGAKIIALSRSGRASKYLYLAIAEKIGAHKVLAKPFQSSDLLLAVDELLNERTA